MKKRITSVLLVLALCLTLLPTAALAADSDHTASEHADTTKFTKLWVRTIDGTSTLMKGDNPWTAKSIPFWGNSDSDKRTVYVLGDGTYYLDSDLNFTDNTSIKDTVECAIAITGDVTLCLNDHSITCSDKQSVISVYAVGCKSLTLTDCSGSSGEKTGEIKGGSSSGIWVGGGSTLDMYGGTITGGSKGYGVYVNESTSGTTTFNMHGGSATGVRLEGGKFTMSGGTISGNMGRGVFMQGGTFTMSGTAKITNNTADYTGGGVYMQKGTFTMNDGKITGNSGTSGGGVYVADGTFTMNGGEISGNTASTINGGGVFVEKGQFTMSGTATITGNTAYSYGGGVYADGTFTMSGGTISHNKAASGGGVYVGGNMTVSGAVKITDNYKKNDTTKDNVYLSDGETITIGTGGLTEGAQIGVTVASSSTNVPTEDNPVAITSANAKEAYKDYFVSDSDKCLIQFNNTNNTVELAAKPKIVLTADNTTITKTSSSFVYDGNQHSPTITVTYTDPDTQQKTVLTENDDYTVSGNTATAFGKYTLTVTGNGDYTGDVQYTWWINKRTISVKEVTLNAKVYNGSKEGSSDDVSSVLFNDATLTKGIDYTIESVTYTDANASEYSQDVTIKVTLTNSNYTFVNSNSTTTATTQGELTKAKAFTATAPSPLTVVNKLQKSYTFELSGLLPELTAPCKYGHIEHYTLDAVNLDGYYDSSDPATINGSTLTLPIKAVETDKEGPIGTVKVKVTTQNYEDITLTINVNASAASEGTPIIDKEPTAQNLTYTGQAQELITEGAATNGTMMYRLEDATDYSAAIPTATEVGRYTVYYMVKGSDGYGDIENEATMKVTATISRASQTVTIPSGKSITKNGVGVDISTWASAAGVPGGSDLGELTYSLTVGAYDGVTLEGTVLTVQKETTAGSIIIKVQAAATKNYEASEEKTFTVTVTDKETVTISGLTYADKTYDGKAIAPAGKLTVTDSKVPAEELEVLYEGTNDTVYSSTEAPKNAGTYKVTYKVADSNENYTGSVTYTFIIASATVTVTVLDQSAYVGASAPDLSSPKAGTHYTVTGLVGNDALIGTVTLKYQKNGAEVTPDTSKAGTYDIVISSVTEPAGGNYNAIVLKNGTLTISKRSTGGGGGGGASAPTYPVSSSNASASAAIGGSVSASTKNASAGDTVTITVSPEAGYRLGKLTVVDKNGKEIPVTLKDGKYTFTMPASQVEIKPVFEKIPAETAETAFPDVPSSAYYAEPVKWAAEKGITSGTKDGGFAPGNTCTRAQIVTFLWRAAGSPEPQTTQTGMTDVSPAAYYAKAVAWAIENGITVGRSDGSFNPNGTCTRANGVTFLYRAAKAAASGNDAGFSDVAADAYYAAAVQWALENGITNGQSNGLFGPNGACTRAQIVTFLYRLYVKA